MVCSQIATDDLKDSCQAAEWRRRRGGKGSEIISTVPNRLILPESRQPAYSSRVQIHFKIGSPCHSPLCPARRKWVFMSVLLRPPSVKTEPTPPVFFCIIFTDFTFLCFQVQLLYPLSRCFTFYCHSLFSKSREATLRKVVKLWEQTGYCFG